MTAEAGSGRTRRTEGKELKLGPFSQLVRDARVQRGLSQQDVAERLDKSKQWINGVERNEPTSLPHVARLHHLLVPVAEPERSQSLGRWLLAWLAQQSERPAQAADKETDVAEAKKTIAAALDRMIPMFPSGLARQTWSSSPLADFPSAFDRLIVISGDRREVPAHSGGDLFVDSASVLDLRFLNQLRLGGRDVPIWHDKVFVQMSEDYLRRHFGNSHLLVVGSPAVNLAARRINSESVFRFNVTQNARMSDKDARAWFPRPVPFADTKMLDFERSQNIFRLQDRPQVEQVDRALRSISEWNEADPKVRFKDAQIDHAGLPKGLVDAADKVLVDEADKVLVFNTLRTWIRQFRPLQIADPADGELQPPPEPDSVGTPLHEDFALVSLAKNPFSDPEGPYVSIFVAGIHGPGTAHAVRALARSNLDFSKRPLGGVLKVQLAVERELPERVTEASIEWVTEPYGPEKIQRHLHKRGPFTSEWESDEVDEWKALVKTLGSRLRH